MKRKLTEKPWAYIHTTTKTMGSDHNLTCPNIKLIETHSCNTLHHATARTAPIEMKLEFHTNNPCTRQHISITTPSHFTCMYEHKQQTRKTQWTTASEKLEKMQWTTARKKTRNAMNDRTQKKYNEDRRQCRLGPACASPSRRRRQSHAARREPSPCPPARRRDINL